MRSLHENSTRYRSRSRQTHDGYHAHYHREGSPFSAVYCRPIPVQSTACTDERSHLSSSCRTYSNGIAHRATTEATAAARCQEEQNREKNMPFISGELDRKNEISGGLAGLQSSICFCGWEEYNFHYIFFSHIYLFFRRGRPLPFWQGSTMLVLPRRKQYSSKQIGPERGSVH